MAGLLSKEDVLAGIELNDGSKKEKSIIKEEGDAVS